VFEVDAAQYDLLGLPMNHKFTVASAIAAIVVTIGGVPEKAAAAGLLVVKSITLRGIQPDGRYHVRLQGRFDSPADVVAVAVCDGKLTPSAVHSATPSILEVSIPPQRGPTRCMFSVHRLTDGTVSGPSVVIDSQGDDEIRESVDRGQIGARHGMELYGFFPRAAALNLSVFCIEGGDINRTWVPYSPNVRFDLRSSTQLNLTFEDIPGTAGRCSFTPIDPASGRATGPLWGPIAIHPTDAYLMAGFGAYHWPIGAGVGPDADDALASGQRWVSRAGFTVGRFWIAPSIRARGDNGNNPYHMNLDVLDDECPVVPQPCSSGTDCNASPPFLPCIARSSAYQRLFRSPNLRYIVLTAADSASSGDFGSVSKLRDPNWFRVPANMAKVVREYRDLALALYETQRDTGKTFIVSSWETDNQIYNCGPGAKCSDAVLAETFDAATQWFMARKQGILQARAIAQARGIAGVSVSDAIEFVRLREGGLKTIDDIIPKVMPEYMTFSAWGSSGGGAVGDPDAGGQLDRDLIRLAARFPNNKPQLLIGELGPADYTGEDPNSARGRNEAWQLAQNARAVQRAQLPVNILWSAYDNINPLLSEGLLFADGRERHVVETLRTELLAGRRELLSSPTARIGGIIVTKAFANGIWWDLFEMFVDRTYGQGRFPSSLAGMVVRCSYVCSGATCNARNMTFDATEIPDSPSRSDFQSDFRLPHKGWADVNLERWCTVSVPGMLTHGPKRLTP
jgi:hypothetical protein